jgi:hypothetical protein
MATNVRSAPPTAVLSIDVGMFNTRVSYTVDDGRTVIVQGGYPDAPPAQTQARTAALFKGSLFEEWGDAALRKLAGLDAAAVTSGKHMLVDKFKLAIQEPARAPPLPPGVSIGSLLSDFLRKVVRRFVMHHVCHHGPGQLVSRLTLARGDIDSPRH